MTLSKRALTIVNMDSSGGPPLPLDGFRVLDFTRFLAGPYAAMVLTSAELEELTKAGVAYNKHPEASQ